MKMTLMTKHKKKTTIFDKNLNKFREDNII